jgi:hypothetical protein
MEKFIYIDFSIPQFEIDLDEMKKNEYNEHIELYKNKIKNRDFYKYENMPNITIESKEIIHFWAIEDGELHILKKYFSVKKGDIIIFPKSWVFDFTTTFQYII